MVKKIAFLCLIIINKLVCMDDSQPEAFILSSPETSSLESPKTSKNEAFKEGIEILENLENALVYETKDKQFKYLKRLSTFMEKDSAFLNNHKKNFEEKLFEVCKEKPGISSIPINFDIRTVRVEKGQFIESHDLAFFEISSELKNNPPKITRSKSKLQLFGEKFKKSDKNSQSPPSPDNSQSNSENSSFLSSPKSSPSSFLQQQNTTSPKPTNSPTLFSNNNPPKLTRSSSKIGEFLKGITKKSSPPPSSENSLNNSENSSLSSGPALKNFQLGKVIINPIFIEWFENYQAHINTIREKFDLILMNYYGDITVKKLEGHKTAIALQKYLDFSIKEE